MDRDVGLDAIRERKAPWDIVIIGGGATGLGTAVDAASRGYAVVLFEQADFAKGTSSRSTKLIHGGVRYLQQGNVSLVMEALSERGRLLQNAPHLVNDLAFIVPSYEWWESPFYGVGLKVYDLLAGKYGFGRSRHLSREKVIEEIPSIQTEGLRGGTRYFDGQFDDARLAISLARTAVEQGAVAVNYTGVVAILKDTQGVAQGVRVCDAETGAEMEVFAKVIVNATGPQADAVRHLDNPDLDAIVAPSQGVHIVLDRSFIPRESAIMVPHTGDGRVMFAIPWRDVTVVGTTDTLVDDVPLEPQPRSEEIDFILDTANRYLARPAARSDIKSVFAGIRPLVERGDEVGTAALSRDHVILIDPNSAMMTVVGGKWTTYRKMAEDVVDQASVLAGLPQSSCVTASLRIHGYSEHADALGGLSFYGADAEGVQALIDANAEWAAPIHVDLAMTGAEVVWACRYEMARTIDDVLARRSRSLLFDARAASEAAGTVGALMAIELRQDASWVVDQVALFRELAEGYIVS
ncbi:MAG: glycerol-3-phosphate dehydrogenase/oxidase [Candidatus Latescibacteria bacterium]|nr:glycerol-3-phosphate dehydrogenase/oxidase [Candidatus Latescibacterota bacterium]